MAPYFLVLLFMKQWYRRGLLLLDLTAAFRFVSAILSTQVLAL